MDSPFPGMDPYLETLALWPDVHHRVIGAICAQLQPVLSPRYSTRITPYVAMESIDIAPVRIIAPDVAVLEHPSLASQSRTATLTPPVVGAVTMEVPTRYGRIEIRPVGSATVVAMIEVLSPVNKRPGAEAADAYERKRAEIFRSDAHLIEIDLLRAGRRPSLSTPWPDADYAVILSRANERPKVGIWPIALADPLPEIPIPLSYPDADAPLDLGAVLRHIYAEARYDFDIDYRQPPPAPELTQAEAQWLDHLLRERGLR
ncbi:MAG: DUF4058 family protein [Thermomicrobiales bacterium]